MIVLGGLIVYFLTSYSYLKLVSLVNFYDKDIEVDMNGQKYTLKPFDTHLIQIKDLRNLNIKALMGDQTIYDKSVNLSYQTQVLGFYFSDIQHCYYQTNLSKDQSNLAFSKIDTPNDYLVADADLDTDSYFLPGSNPQDIDHNKTLVGFLPVLCTEVGDANIVLANNQLFWNYNAELQREYYFNNVDKIKNSTDLNQLGDVKGAGQTRLEYLNFGGGDILFIPSAE